VRLGTQWDALGAEAGEARIRLTLEEAERADRAAQLLGPLQPLRSGAAELTFQAPVRSAAVKRLLERLDRERIHGVLAVVASDPAPARPPAPPAPALRASWDAALAALPPDWSDLLAELELSSSDDLDRAAVRLAPLNPRRDGARVAFRFRSARSFGYGASPQMVRRCLERLDADRIRGSVRVLRVLCDTRPVQTQGPVWQLGGRTV